MYPDRKIEIGMATEEGTALLKNYNFEKTKSKLEEIWRQAQNN
jgi:hypothetical protein